MFIVILLWLAVNEEEAEEATKGRTSPFEEEPNPDERQGMTKVVQGNWTLFGLFSYFTDSTPESLEGSDQRPKRKD